MAKSKFYVVWEGRNKGIYGSWGECKQQTEGYEGAKYKSFESQTEALEAFSKSYFSYINTHTPKAPKLFATGSPLAESVVVDAAWNTKTGDMEYQGIELKTKKLLFKKGPFSDGTNNIGEFLAIVHALALLKKHGLALPVYSDSKTAISWVRKKTANTKLQATTRNAELFDLLKRAEEWLAQTTFENPILKWETKHWGENPADFGRK